MRDSRTRSRSRSRSPPPRRGDDNNRDKERRHRHHHKDKHHSSRDRSRRHHHHHHRRSHSRHRSSHEHQDTPPSIPLPFNRLPLSKSSLNSHLPLFQSYLHRVKNIDLPSLSETELKGRWKSFMGKWNRGELVGDEWYNHPSLPSPPPPPPVVSPALESLPPSVHSSDFEPVSPATNQKEEDDDEYGPVLPSQVRQGTTCSHRHGPKIPTRDDLLHRDEILEMERDNALEDHRYERKTFRKSHRELLDELVPKADAGSRERKLEKKKEVNEKLKGFAQAKEEGVEEVGDKDLMGGGDDALEELRRMKRLREQRQNQRQSKRDEEEMLRRQEREERVREYKEREERVMEGLRGLVRERFGGP
ncbi:hypothetical protein QBC36DRAFT_385703 [Triangularia setosa]|uniref:Uncharacterized protein n=1 Tax=Triangularia setosa TaxID=2587417 RepID=A0AAN6WB14_9PEZI|nr:hypothetical protein QBC36DRAFT_385703 [Podospora setosa]